MRRPAPSGTQRPSPEGLSVPAFPAVLACAFLLLMATGSASSVPSSQPMPTPGTPGRDTLFAGAGVPASLRIAPDLLARLQVLADALHKEIVLCLHGDVDGDRAHLTRLSMPAPLHSAANRARFGPCPDDTLAVWHNHAVPPPGVRAARPVLAGGPAGLCRLSAADVRTASAAGHPFTIVSVDASTLCWWTLAEVRGLERDQLP